MLYDYISWIFVFIMKIVAKCVSMDLYEIPTFMSELFLLWFLSLFLFLYEILEALIDPHDNSIYILESQKQAVKHFF